MMTLALSLVLACAAAFQTPQGLASPDPVNSRLEEAKALLGKQGPREALAILKSLADDPALAQDAPLHVQIRYYLGASYAQLSDYPNAAAEFRRAGDLSRAQGDRRMESRSLQQLAQAFKNSAKYDEGLRWTAESRQAAQAIGDRELEARALTTRGGILDITGRHREALENYRAAETLYAGAEHQTAIRLQNEIGITLKNLGLYQDAIASYTKALDAQTRSKDRYGQGVTLLNLGNVQSLLGQDDRALDSFRQSLEIAREVGDRRGESILVGNLGSVLLDRGQPARALEYFERQRELTRALGNRNEEGLALKGAGDAHLAKGDLIEAGRHYDQALAIQREIGVQRRIGVTLVAVADLALRQGRASEAGRLAAEALTLAGQTDTPELDWRARLSIARAAAAEGRSADAIAQLRASAAIINDLRANVWVDAAKIGFVDARQAVFQELAGALLGAGRPADALEAAESGRARAFADLLEQRQVQGKPAQQDRLADVRATLRQARGTLPSRPGAGEDDAVRRRGALDGTIDRLRDEDRELASLVTAESPTQQEISQIAARLDATLISYLVTERQTLAWAVTPGGRVHGVAIDVTRERLDGLVSTLRKQIDVVDAARLARPARIRELRDLHRLLVEPLRAWLPSSPEALVIVVPHGPLALLPFAALEDAAGRPMVARHTLAYAPAIAVYRYTPGKRHADAAPSALVVADPAPPADSGLAALPGARTEGQRVARRLGATARLLTGKEASEAAVKRGAPGQRILHLATHGLISAERPLASSLLLSPGEGDDGYLRADEIFNLPLSADLVVLSGCSTGLGRLSGDGIIGLGRAFIFAGTPSVVVSQWDVMDAATAPLMDRFYASLATRRGPAAALRAAQLDARRRSPHPSSWAAFAVIGEPR
jgi:CHAT domain-containing protein/tetratricopeptide (TPR) repeat protein